jgi:hypothetical protein
VLFACSGIAIECQENLTRFLTSATLARAFISGDKRKFHDNLKVGAGNRHVLFLLLVIFKCDHCVLYLSVIIVCSFLALHCRLKCAMKAMKCTRVFCLNMI